MPTTPIVKALAKMTAERMKTMTEALFNNSTNFLTKNCPQNPAATDTAMRNKAYGMGNLPKK